MRIFPIGLINEVYFDFRLLILLLVFPDARNETLLDSLNLILLFGPIFRFCCYCCCNHGWLIIFDILKRYSISITNIPSNRSCNSGEMIISIGNLYYAYIMDYIISCWFYLLNGSSPQIIA